MNVGLLNNITPSEEQAWNLYEYSQFRNFLDQVDNTINLIEYRVTEGELPLNADDCDAYLLTGSSYGAYEDIPWIHSLTAFIQKVNATKNIKMIGICFGHQILAHALGGKVEKAKQGWGLGRREFQLQNTLSSDTPSWMTPLPKEHALYYAHQDQVIKLPEDAQRLASDSFCQNGMFLLNDRILGIQGHPEFTDDTAEQTITLLKEQTTPNVCRAANESLNQGKADGKTLAQWIINFLNQAIKARA